MTTEPASERPHVFDPYCSRCERRVLLGTRRIVWSDVDRGGGPPVVVLRCFCGALVHWDAQPPPPVPVAPPAGSHQVAHVEP